MWIQALDHELLLNACETNINDTLRIEGLWQNAPTFQD